jgi:hypothetical protein
MQLIRVTGRQGSPRDVVLLSPAGDGRKYDWRGSWYISMPLGFWTNEWIYHLAGSGIALLPTLRDMRSDRKPTDPPLAHHHREEPVRPPGGHLDASDQGTDRERPAHREAYAAGQGLRLPSTPQHLPGPHGAAR